MLLTIGHSSRSLDELLGLLARHGADCLVDVRSVPRSRRNPQFNKDTLRPALAEAGIDYRHASGLGGWRKSPDPDSPNQGLTSPGFRAYADYMQSDAFERELGEVLALADEQAVALMCAEAVPWRCHRSLIADAATVRGVSVHHITGPGPAREHRCTPWAEVEGTRLTYPFTLQPR